jgi:hypothetical protein
LITPGEYIRRKLTVNMAHIAGCDFIFKRMKTSNPKQYSAFKFSSTYEIEK